MSSSRNGGQRLGPPPPNAQFRLTAPSVGFCVEVSLTERGGRWFGIALANGETLPGIGVNPRQALRACLSPLGPAVSSALMADPAIFGASWSLLRDAVAQAGQYRI